jgi:hypothetical protein
MTNLPTQTPWKRIVTAMAKNPPTTAEETNRLPTPKTKKHHKQRFYRFVSSMRQSIFSSY